MIVETLIEKLQEMDPSANVVLEGEEETECFCLREACEDDNGSFVMLLRGRPMPVRVEEDAPLLPGAGEPR